MQLMKYEDFINRVEELGFLAFSKILDGLPSLTSETPEKMWHTGDPKSDPWCWKDRAAEEKRLAFGCILGGNKGFIAPRLYPVFHAAYHPVQSMEERRFEGLISQTTWDLWKLFEEKKELDTGEIRRLMGVTKKKGSSRVDSAISELQQYFYITVAGSKQRTDKFGQPFGWHINFYNRVEDWTPPQWLQHNPPPPQPEAIQTILDLAITIGSQIDRPKLTKALCLK